MKLNCWGRALRARAPPPMWVLVSLLTVFDFFNGFDCFLLFTLEFPDVIVWLCFWTETLSQAGPSRPLGLQRSPGHLGGGRECSREIAVTRPGLEQHGRVTRIRRRQIEKKLIRYTWYASGNKFQVFFTDFSKKRIFEPFREAGVAPAEFALKFHYYELTFQNFSLKNSIFLNFHVFFLDFRD